MPKKSKPKPAVPQVGSSDEGLVERLKYLERSVKVAESDMGSILLDQRLYLAAHATNWIHEYVRALAEEYPVVIKALGTERIRELKAAIAEVVEGIPKLVDDVVAAKSWPHNAVTFAVEWPLLAEHMEQFEGRIGRDLVDDFFTEVFREAVSTLGPVLNRFYILEVTDPRWTLDYESGVIRYADDFLPTGNGFFPWWRDPSFEYRVAIDRYRELAEQLMKDRETLKRELEREEARRLWDSA